MEMTTNITAKANATRMRDGIRSVQDTFKQRRTWFQGRLCNTGFAASESGLGFADAESVPGKIVRTCIDARTTDEIEAIAGPKPNGLSWRDFGRIFALAYAAGGRDALVLRRVEMDAHRDDDRAYLAGKLEDLGATREQVEEIVRVTFG
jgi:hypothetical protein